MVARRGSSAWTEERIRQELREFLRDRSEWPTYREFQRSGRRTLRDRVTRTGGVRRWARDLGIPYGHHSPGYAPTWTEERLREELRRYLSGHSSWPSRVQFEQDGLTALRNAVNRHGGADRWAAELGVSRATRRMGARRGWSKQRIEAELEGMLANRTTWPSRREFEQAGLYSMLVAIYRHEGPGYWARRFGVARDTDARRPRRTVWTKERIRAELARFCAGREAWPTERQFSEAGQRALYHAASRNGGVAYWAELLALPRPRKRGH